MAHQKSRYLSAVLCGFGIICTVLACHRVDKAGRAERTSVLCARVCDRSVNLPHEMRGPNCESHCLARVVGSSQRCEKLIGDWLVCLSATTAGTVHLLDGAISTPDENRCELERQLVERCEEACRNEGALQAGELSLNGSTQTVSVFYELTDCGCGNCNATVGAETNAPCTSAKICEERRYRCDGGLTQMRLRACEEHRCVTPTSAARVLEQVVPGRRCVPFP
jgi:hypothetical protein